MAPPDGRDEITWVVYELTHAGERLAQEGQLESHLRRVLKLDLEHPVFVPYLTMRCDGKNTLFTVMEGYAFVASGLDDRLYFSVTHESAYLQQALHSKQGRTCVLMTVPDEKVRDLKARLQDMIAVEIQQGMLVEVSHGAFKGLEGIVAELTPKHAHVLFELRTLRTIRTFPRHALLPKG